MSAWRVTGSQHPDVSRRAQAGRGGLTTNENSMWNVVSSSGKRKKLPSAHLFSRFCTASTTLTPHPVPDLRMVHDAVQRDVPSRFRYHRHFRWILTRDELSSR